VTANILLLKVSRVKIIKELK